METQTNTIGRLIQVVSGIALEAIKHLHTPDFFKTKAEGGIFMYVDYDIFNWLETEIKNSSSKVLASYELIEGISEEGIIGDAKAGGIYEETDMAHVKQICERHIIKGEKLLQENGSNFFQVRDKQSGLCLVDVWLDDGGWRVYVIRFRVSHRRPVGARSFFRNQNLVS